MTPLRVWEETWLYVSLKEGPLVETHNGCALRESFGEVYTSPEQTEARLKLAAQAPAMARTLMTLAGMGSDPYCNGCGDTSKRGHKRDCALMQLLFDAGVGHLTQADRSPVLRIVKPEESNGR